MRDDDPAIEPPVEPPARSSADESERRFLDIVAVLRADDPEFARRCSAPAAGTPSPGTVAVVVGIALTLLLGVAPLAVGLWASSVVLIALGAITTLVLPVMAPLAVIALLEHRRPLWV